MKVKIYPNFIVVPTSSVQEIKKELDSLASFYRLQCDWCGKSTRIQALAIIKNDEESLLTFWCEHCRRMISVKENEKEITEALKEVTG